MASVTIAQAKKRFGPVEVLHGVDIQIPDGSFTVLVGPSGCGKSTLLRMLAGLEQISDGEIRIGDKRVNDVPPKQRDIAMVFQNYALYPHMTVRENMAFSLMLAKTDKATTDAKVGRAAEILGLQALLDRYPRQLSGGQRQRVALGRAIVREPKAFLMDEPLSNLDAKLRVQMRTEIAKLHNRIGTTTIYVTHDQTEAMTMADRIVVLKDGLVQQIATPQIMYDQPDNVFVAGFIGSPAMNFIRARLEKENDEHVVVFGRTRIPVGRDKIGEAKERGHDPESFGGKDVILGIRPEHVEDAGTEEAAAVGGAEGSNTMEVEPQVIESMGSEKYVYFGIPSEQAAHLGSVDDMSEGDGGGNGSADTIDEMMVARVSAESTAKEGQQMRLVIDPSKVQLFDPESEKSIL